MGTLSSQIRFKLSSKRKLDNWRRKYEGRLSPFVNVPDRWCSRIRLWRSNKLSGYMKQACHGSCPQFCPKPCEWGSWTEGHCDRTCGGGVRKDTRRKLIQEQNGGYCPGGDYRIESCNTQQCPVCACKDAINPRGRHWGNCLKNYHGGKICYVQDEANSGCKDKVRSGSFKPNYYSWDACK